MAPENLLSLAEAVAAEDRGGHVLIYSPDHPGDFKSYSYQEMLQVAGRLTSGLVQRGGEFRPGTVILLHFNNPWDNIVWFWAVLFAGCIPAISAAFPSHPSDRAEHLEHLSAVLDDPWCITSEQLLPQFVGQESIHPITMESLDRQVPASGIVTARSIPDHREVNPSDGAVILFTSGSSGKPKAVCLNHGQVLAAIRGKYSVLSLPAQTSFLNWVGLDHVVGIVEIHLQALYARMDQLHVAALHLLSHPLDFLSLLEKHRVSRTFAPNFFLAKVRDALQRNADLPCPRRWDLSALRYIASGGEANVTRTCTQLSGFLTAMGAPANVIVPGFGMTETCAGAIFNTDCPAYDNGHALEFASVGRCMQGIRMRVTDGSTSNNVLAAGELGQLEVTGPVVVSSYYNNPIATAESFTTDGWFRTGDMGRIGTDGMLKLEGRSKESIIVNGVGYNPCEIESALDGIVGLTPGFTCCFSSFPQGGETEQIYVVYLPICKDADLAQRAQTVDAVSQRVLMLTGSRPDIIPLESESLLRKSAMGKVSRHKIKSAFQQGLYREYQEACEKDMREYRQATRTHPQDHLEERLLAIFTDSLGVTGDFFDVATPIFGTGISSVELIKLKTDIENGLGLPSSDLPIMMLLENPTVRDLAKAVSNNLEKVAGKKYNPVVALRTDGHKKPLWLIHPGAGEILIFLNLAKFLVDRPVYALRARGFGEEEDPFTNIEEAAATYHQAIKLTQPKGPYALAGYCYGAMLAFEVSKILQSAGDEVRFLGSFNLPPHIKTRMRELDWKECLLHLAYFLDLMTQARSRELAVELGGDTSREEILETVIQNSDPGRFAELSLTRPTLIRWANVAHKLHDMAGEYDPAGCVPGIDVFYSVPLAIAAASMSEWRHEHLSKWEEFTTSTPRFYSVGGEHYSMIGPGHVFGFQKTLRQALDNRNI